MKLISMTEFVLKQKEELNPMYLYEDVFVDTVTNYATFLSQPLELGMFIPCVDGVPIEEPQLHTTSLGFDDREDDYCAKEVAEYIEARSKVLFEGFEIVNSGFENVLIHVNENKYIGTFANGKFLFSYKFIEDLTIFNPTLTQSAIKQIGL